MSIDDHADGPDTAARSLSHWSEHGRAEMDAFYALARRDYEQLALGLDHRAWLRQVARGRDRIALLDVACGSGQFPSALLRDAGVSGLAGELRIDYDLLDPSAFSLEEAAHKLRTPFVEASRHQALIEQLDDSAGPFDVVWATHALYALSPQAVRDAARRILAVLAPDGALLIAQGSRDGHYLRFYRHFLDDLRDGRGTMYASAEDIVAALQAVGLSPKTLRLSYDQTIELGAEAIVEGYLQRCAFDDSVALAQMRQAQSLGPYLDSCRDEHAGVWRFHQEVDVILVGEPFTTTSK